MTGAPNVNATGVLAKIQAFRRAVELGCADAVKEASMLTQALARQTMTDKKIVDRGLTRASIDYEIRVTPQVASGIVYVGTPWGVWIEFGRRGTKTNVTGHPLSASAARPPIQPILEWVRRNYRNLAPSGRTKSGRARKPTPADLLSAAIAIATAIEQRGIRARPFLRPSYRQVAPTLPKIVANAIQRRRVAMGVA